MKKYLIVLGALAATLILPFMLRPSEERREIDPNGTLTIISPHVESIRSEFTRAFQRFMKDKHKRNVEIQWLTPGGTSEIDKYVETEYRAAFENYWGETQSEKWTAEAGNAVALSKPVGDDQPRLKAARDVFLNSNLGIKIDLFFGGGTYDFEKQKKKGYLVATTPDGAYGPAAIKKAHPDWFTDAIIPQTFSGQPFYDPDLCWVGNCLSSFGIVYNKDVLERIGISEPPRQWTDLTSPSYSGAIALADPGKSASAAMAFEMIIQQQMQQALARLKKASLTPNPTAAAPIKTEAEAISEGWMLGLQIIQKIAANARYFTDSAPRPPMDVSRGEAAAGMAIDFYGKTFVEKLQQPNGECRVVYLTPEGGSSVSADAIGMFRGAPNPELATIFMEYVLSLEGQRLWGHKSGTPGGPTRVALRRLPIRKDYYVPAERALASDPEEMPYEKINFNYNAKYTGPAFNALRLIVRAMCLDTQEEMKTAWHELVRHGFPPRATENFSDLRLISYEKVMTDIAKVCNGSDKLLQARLARDLGGMFRNQYLNATAMALRGE